LASSAAPTMTLGLDVMVQAVIAAVSTELWSTAVVVTPSRVSWVGCEGRLDERLLWQWRLAAAGLICEPRGQDPSPNGRSSRLRISSHSRRLLRRLT
jgi:hypothetical protein